jgi:RNA polymerase sigma-70 factor, ECF subfamily
MGKNDHDAIRAVLAGDKDAYGALVVRHSASLFRVAFRMTGNQADADDVVQDAFLRGYRKLESFESRASFSTWIYRIAVRCALDKIESRKGLAASRVADETDLGVLDVQVMDDSAGPERILLSGEMAAARQAAMGSLTATEQSAFVLRHMENRTTEEISVALGIQPNAAKQAVYRAVHKLRQRLAPLRVNA